MTEVMLVPGTSEFGRLFEQMIIFECVRLNNYFEKEYRFYYSWTKDGADIPHQEKWVLCTEKAARKTPEGIRILNWRDGLKELFGYVG